MLDVIDLGELAAGVGGDELVELALGLLAEVGTVDEEKDAAGAGELDQPIGEGAGGVGLAGAGGHLDERAGAVGGEGFLKGGDGLDLALAEMGGRQRMRGRQRGEAGTQRVGLGKPGGECRGLVESEDATRARPWVTLIAEEGFDPSRFVGERNRFRAGEKIREEVGEVFAVVGGLLGDGGKRGAFFFGLDHAERDAINEEEVVAAAGLERNLAERDAAGGGRVESLVVLDGPIGSREHRVDRDAGLGLGHGRGAPLGVGHG